MTTQGDDDMTGSGSAIEAAARDAAKRQALADALARLDQQEHDDEAPLEHLGEKEAEALGGMYKYPDRKWREHMEGVRAEVPAGARLAARAGEGEDAALYEDLEQAEADLVVIDAPVDGVELDKEAAAILAEIGSDLDAAMEDSVELNADAEKAQEGGGGHNSVSAFADTADAQELLKAESVSLADSDKALAQLEADMQAAGEEPPAPKG